MNARSVSVLLTLLVVVSLVPTAMAAGFELSASDTTPVPERTVDVEGQSFTVDSMVRVSEGESVSLDVSGPDERYDVYLYDSDRSIVANERGEGDESFTFDLSGYDHGSYVIAVEYDGSFEAVQPLIVSGYDVSVDAPSSVSSGEDVEVSVDVSETAASASPTNVTVIVAQGDWTHDVDATESGGEYTATVDGGVLDDGDYSVYAVAQGDEEAFGRSELLGLSDGHSLTVASDSDDSDSTDDSEETNESDSDESDSDGESDSDDDAENESDGSEATDDSESSDESNESDGGANPPDDETESPTETATETATPTDTDDVITPGEDTGTESTGASGPGFTVVGAVVAIALVALLGRRRS